MKVKHIWLKIKCKKFYICYLMLSAEFIEPNMQKRLKSAKNK